MLKVLNKKYDYVFHGKQEKDVRSELDHLFNGNKTWTDEILLDECNSIRFNLDNIVSIENKYCDKEV